MCLAVMEQLCKVLYQFIVQSLWHLLCITN
jgi:hypothetical protein